MAVDLPTQMNGKDSLNGWDMLIAYNEDVLNTSLAERASEVPKLLTGLDPIPISDTGKTAPSSALCHAYSPLAIGVVDPITRKTVVRYTANIQLKTPRVSFDTSGFGSVGPALVLVFPVTGSLTEPGTSVPIPDDLSLTCCTPLLYVSGSTGTTTQPGQVVVFDPTQVSTQNITLDFTKPSLKFTAPKGSATDVVQYNIDIAPRMVNHFVQTGGLEYRLAGITNAIPNSTTGNTTLQPSSFIFTLDPGEPSATPAIPGALLTWISLVGSTSTPLHPDPRQSLLFSLGGMTPVSPLMPSSSASIILAHNTMWSFFFKPGIEKSGGSETNCTSTIGTSGMTFKAKLPSSQVDAPGSDVGNTGYDGFSYNMNDHPSDIIVDHTGLTLTFVYNQRISIWEYHSGWKGLTWKEEGKADVSCTITDSAAWTSSGATNVLSLVFPGGPKLLNTTCNPVDRSIWEKIASGDGPGVPDGWKYLKVTISPLSLNFGGLDYFLATNLLFPGEHVFNADPITTGLHIPRDTLITGNLHKPSATLQSRGLLRGGQSTKTSVTALVERFLAPAGGPILGDYLSALGSTENQMENVEAFLSKYNIDDWTGDELSYITGQRYNSNSTAVSTDNRKVPLLQYEQGLPNIGAVSEEPSFDIRLYGAWYKIDAPFTMKDGDLLVNPQTGKITVQSIETTPTVTEKDGTHTVSFTAGGNSFTMVFDSNIDSSTGNFKLSFTGKVKYPSGSSEDFKGKQYTPAPGDAGLGSGFAKTINILALVGFGVGVFGCLGILQSYLYRREDKKNAIETPEAKARRELTERNNATVKTQLETIHRLMTEMAASRAAQIDPSVSSRLSDSVESVVESSVRESSSAVDFSDLSGESSLASPPFDSILDRSNSAARSEIELQVHANQLAPVVDSLAGWRHSAFLSVAEQRQIAQDAVTPVVQAAQLRLEQSGFVRQKALSVMLDEHAKQQEQRKREKQTELDNLALEASRTAIEQAAAEIAEKRAADKLAAETDPNKKEEEQAALERERADVAKIKDEAERQREAIAARERERDEAARKEKEIEEAREKAERAAEEAKKREEE